METPNNVEISIIIPVYNDLEGLKITVTSIKKQVFSGYEVIVINDGADRATHTYCESQEVQCIDISPNKGSYNARNAGLVKAKGEYIAFTDADVTVKENWLANGKKHLANNDYVAGDVIIEWELVKNTANYHDFLTAFRIAEYFELYHFGVTANLFVRRDVFDKIGFFDADLQSGGDHEFGDRVYHSSLGLRQFFAADCLVTHPPRSHREKIIKLERIKKGRRALLEKYPDRFHFIDANPNYGWHKFLPPSLSRVKKLYQANQRFSFYQLYAYMCKLKIAKFWSIYLPSGNA